MKYMQVNVEYDCQTVHGLISRSIGLIVSPNLRGSSLLYEKVELFIKRKFCQQYGGNEFQGFFIKECKIIHCSKRPVFDVE